MIRKAHMEDADQILSLLISTPELQGSGEMDAVYSREYVEDCILDDSMNLLLVAEEELRIVGLLLAEIWEKKKYSFFVNFVVLQDQRAKGIGSSLYAAYEAHCRAKGLRIITALVHSNNTRMQEFCERRGYKKGHELYFFEKEL